MMQIVREYIQENQKWLKLVVQWFLIAAVCGAATAFIKPDLLNKILDLFKDKFGANPNQNLSLAFEIFLQNSVACFFALLGGVLLGISAFLIVFFNGFIIGFVIITLFMIPGNPLRNSLYIVAGLVPHGIFELPAFFLASAMGIRFGTQWISHESKDIRWKVFSENFVRVCKLIPALEILLIIAAFLEVFVSGKLVGNF